jgi:hypothetical protein
LADFVDAHGVRGRLRGDLGWALGAWGVFYSNLAAAIAFAVSLHEPLGLWVFPAYAAIEFAVALAWSRAFAWRTMKLWREAEAKGYPLVTLKKEALAKGALATSSSIERSGP